MLGMVLGFIGAMFTAVYTFKCTARIRGGGNIKLGARMGTFSKLYGKAFHYVEKLGIAVKGTCGGHCAGCEGSCYVAKSYRRYKSVILGHARNTIAFRQDICGSFEALHKQLSRKRVPFQFVRINQSGELETSAEFCGWIGLARLHPETTFYLYTKAFDLVEWYLLNMDLPENITILYSIWHEYGISEYKRVAHVKNVKAFAYVDGRKPGGWTIADYAARGLDIQTTCTAYGTDGKMDHAVTCEKCRKCIRHGNDCKVIGCNDH